MSSYCAACYAPTPAGYLCTSCTTELREALTELAPGRTMLPSYAARPAGHAATTRWDLPAAAMVGGLAAHLELTATRQARIGSATRGASDERPPPFDEPASALLGYLQRVLTPWCRYALDLGKPPIDPPRCPHRTWIGADCPACADLAARHSARWADWQRTAHAIDRGDVAALAGYLLEQLHVLTVRADTGDLHQAVTRSVERVREIIDAPDDQEYVGVCGAELPDEATCWRPLYCEPKAVKVECVDRGSLRGCGAVWKVADRRARLLEVAEDHLDTAANIATALTSLDNPVSPERIRQWKKRGRLIERPKGSKLYRVGDVLDLLAQDLAAEARRTAS